MRLVGKDISVIKVIQIIFHMFTSYRYTLLLFLSMYTNSFSIKTDSFSYKTVYATYFKNLFLKILFNFR